MGKKAPLLCPHCNSSNIKRNGHHYGGKIQYFCYTCDKYFSEDVAKGYPISKIPFPVIAYLLYFRKKIPSFSNMREFRKFSSQWLNCLDLKKEGIQRHTIYHWIKNYESNLDKIISFKEACDYCQKIYSEKIKSIPEETLSKKVIPHTQVLCVLEENLGRSFCINLARSDPLFFNEICDLVSKYHLYCQQNEKEKRMQGRPVWRPIFMRFFKCLDG